MGDPLALATTLSVMRALGSSVEVHDGWRLLRTPQAPGPLWGDALIVDDPALLKDLPALLALFARVQPTRQFPSFFLPSAPDEAAWNAVLAERGEQLIPMRWSALVAREPIAPVHLLPDGIEVHACANDAEWAALDVFDNDDYVAQIRRLQRAACERGQACFFTARSDGRVMGVAGVVLCGDGVARMQDVRTDEAFRRQGTASHLIATADAWAREHGCEATVIVADADREAIGLYQRLGFQITDETHFVVSRPQ